MRRVYSTRRTGALLHHLVAGGAGVLDGVDRVLFPCLSCHEVFVWPTPSDDSGVACQVRVDREISLLELMQARVDQLEAEKAELELLLQHVATSHLASNMPTTQLEVSAGKPIKTAMACEAL